MDLFIVGMIGIILLFALMALKVPVGFAMAIVGFAGYSYINNFSTAYSVVAVNFFSTFSSYSLATVPMFVLMGFIASYSGIGANLFDTANKFVGHLKGGLAVAVQMACAMFGAICGSLIATVATMGSVAVPEMRKYNYNMSFSCASIAAGASLGSLIPPSIVLIVYGVAAEQSIGRLFLGGILPGILHMVVYIVTVILLAWYNPSFFPVGEKANWDERISSLGHGGVIEALIIFLLSLGGLFLGWFTPTEAGAFGAFTFLVLTLVERRMNWEKTVIAFRDTTKLTAMIFMLVAGATIFGRFITVTRIPFELGAFVVGLDVPPYIIILLIVAICLVLGLFIDAMALILLIIPVFFPVVETLGYDPIWFGIIIVVIGSMGVITPPVGVNIFVISGVVPDVHVEHIFKGIWPFIIADWVFVGLLLLFPSIVIFLPELLF